LKRASEKDKGWRGVDMNKAKILVVEDKSDVATMIKLALEGEGYAVVVAEDGRKGLEAVQHESPDLVILDVMLPLLDGYSLLRELKRKEQQDDTKVCPPIIVSTAKGNGIQELFEMEGVAGYMVKPYGSEELLEKVKLALSSRT